MNFDFYSAHFQTLSELQQMAEKHNCKITFGFTSDVFDGDDTDELLDIFNCPDKVREEIIDDFSIELKSGMYTKIYFELYDRDKQHYNQLTYYQHEVLVELENTNRFNYHSNETEEWLEENKTDWSNFDDKYYLYSEDTKEEVHGFEGIKKEWNIYRPGIMLAVFTQLVCDYLGEERIVRTY